MRIVLLSLLSFVPMAHAGFVFDFEVSENGKTHSARIPPNAREFGITLKESPFKCVLKTDENEKMGHLSSQGELWCCVEKPTLSQCAVALGKCTKEDDSNTHLVLVDIVPVKPTSNEKADPKKKPVTEEVRRATVSFHCMYIDERETAALPLAEPATDVTGEESPEVNTPPQPEAPELAPVPGN